MTDDYQLQKVLDKIKMIVGIQKKMMIVKYCVTQRINWPIELPEQTLR